VIELAEIFQRYGPSYRAKFGAQMPTSQHRAMRAIQQCRTPALGGHVYECPACGETRYQYHSCRNRHCPKCQGQKAHQWLAKQQTLLLPTPYFLLTFTLPGALRALARRQPQLFYNLLFQTSAAAVQKLARDPRFIGGQVGLVGVLHTWGRNLAYHPHVHYLLPAGGLADEGAVWRPAKKNFLLPVKALSKIFRAMFRDALRQEPCFAQVPASVWAQEWVVHCQPVGRGLPALKYLAPYIFRVAISNKRLLKLEADQVTFQYRASDTGQSKLCTLDALEFIRRFLQHVLPQGFVKVRYYGFFSSGQRARLAALRRLLGAAPAESTPTPAAVAPPTFSAAAAATTAPPGGVMRCPSCGQVMQRRPIIRARGDRPP
jgi:hypothetical protein